MLNILTIDLEDWYMEAPPRKWDSFEDRIEEDTRKVLDLLSRHDVRATFFVLGYIARRHPALIRQVAEAGHEVALHGMVHDLVYEKDASEFAEELCRAKEIVEDAAGVQAWGFRAPYFSIVRRSLWALPVIASCGMVYDSSIFPTWHFRYGIPGWPPFPGRIDLTPYGGEGLLAEIPISTLRVAGLHVPFSGGGYLRMLPRSVVARGVRSLNRRGHPAVLYFHPWEIDPQQPHMWGPAGFRFRHYVGLRGMRDKLDRLLGEFSFITAAEFVSRMA